MNLSDYFQKEGRGAASRLCSAIEAHSADVSDWASGERPIPVPRCVAIERATNGEVTRQDLRPDDYWLIWPDLTAPTEKVA